MKISIIVPCRDINYQTIKCIRECLNQDYRDFEIIVLPDYTNKKSKNNKLKIIETGKVKPALKRNLGMEKAEGELYAFIDDDAYPRKNWLKNVVKYFKNDKIGIVGGPNLTPKEANFAEHVSGHVLSNFFVLGPPSIRYKIAKNQYVRELPSCNYISRKLDIKYDENYLTAEDSKYCFDASKKGYKVYYVNDVIVDHHRRDTLIKHLKQMYIYARDIAWLTKKEFTFDKLIFSILGACVLLFSAGIIGSIFNTFIRNWFLIVVLAYMLVMLLVSIRNNVKTSFFVWIISMGTHFAYGIGWLIGILSTQEKTPKVIWNSR